MDNLHELGYYIYTDSAKEAESTGDTQTITKNGDELRTDFYNDLDKGSLKVKKTVVGDQVTAADKFVFTLTFTPADEAHASAVYGKLFTVSGADSQKSIRLSDSGIGTLTLLAGETAVISGLPAGTTYKVVETDYHLDGYVTTYLNAEGTIAASLDSDEAP